MTIADFLISLPDSPQNDRQYRFTMTSTDAVHIAGNLIESAFIELYYAGTFTCCERVSFNYQRDNPISVADLSFKLPTCAIEREFTQKKRNHYLLRGDDWWASAEISGSHVAAYFGARSNERVRELAQRFTDAFETKEPRKVTTDFEVWSGDIFPVMRSFPDTQWSDISTNYPETTRKSLDRLFQLTPSDLLNNGRIILFHGQPGTGKTWAIRSLLTTWKGWGRGAVIIDPDQLFEQSNYFMNLLDYSNGDQTHILVIEDADEIAEKNGTRGSNLSRLLNATDGLVGANSDLLVVLSTNAAPEALDRALVRPGRCLAAIEFTPFTSGEASSRLGHRVQSEKTLAEIYEVLGVVSKVANTSSVGSTGQYL
jgi:hypothetical protein